MAVIDERTPFETGACCMKQHAEAVPPWTCDCPCHTYIEEPVEERSGPDETLLSDGDLGLAPTPKTLSPEQVLRLGAWTLAEERSEAVERLLSQQEDAYRLILKLEGPEPLVRALLERDRHLAQTGRALADGRTAGRLLREVMRAMLQGSDHQTLRAIGDATKAGRIEEVLQLMGAEPADANQLKKHGSTLGALESPEARAQALADGRRKS